MSWTAVDEKPWTDVNVMSWTVVDEKPWTAVYE